MILALGDRSAKGILYTPEPAPMSSTLGSLSASSILRWLSDEEIRAAQERDLADVEALTAAPVRVLLVGQVSAGKSSLVNAMAVAVRAAVGPLPTTAHVSEHRLELEGTAVILVDMPGLDEHLTKPEELLREAARADLIVWVASATQPARASDRQAPRRSSTCWRNVKPKSKRSCALCRVW